MKLVIGILSTIVMVILLVSTSQSETITTPNLLSGNFLDGSWSGDTTSNHGSNIIAGVDKQSISSTISVIDDGQLYQFEMNQGFTSTQEAEVWFWNSAEQSVIISQTIVGDSGSTISQSLQIEGTCINFNGCDYQDTGTNTIVIGANNETDYDIISNFSFSVPGYSGMHMGADLKNPSLTISFTLPDFVENFEAVNEWEEIKFKEEDIWAEGIFEQFYMEEEEIFFTSPPMNFEPFEPPKEYIMEYEDESIKEMDMDFQTFNSEDFSQPEYEEMLESEYEENTKEFSDLDSELPDNSDEKEQSKIEEEEYIEEADEDPMPMQVESKDYKDQVSEIEVKEEVNIKIRINKFDAMRLETELKLNIMIGNNSDMFFAPTVFYEEQILYEFQPAIFDNREIYKDITFIANDPLVVFNTKLRNNRNIQNQQRIELESMTWKN
jgi:hypothetical protein